MPILTPLYTGYKRQIQGHATSERGLSETIVLTGENDQRAHLNKFSIFSKYYIFFQTETSLNYPIN